MAGYYVSKRVRFEPYAKHLFLGGFLCLIAAFILNLHFELRFYFFTFSFGALAMILGGAHVSGWFRDWLSHPSLVLLGHASFAFYLLHDPVLRYSKALLDRAHLTLSFPVSVLAGVALFGLLCLGSIVCFRCYENPIRLKLRNLLKPVQRPRTPAPAKLEDIAIPK
jgi:peptidoglycan/LPS O-acetylase OafA/YrhL